MFRDLPLHAQDETVVEGARVIQAVFVADQGAGHGADFEELVPVGVLFRVRIYAAWSGSVPGRGGERCGGVGITRS